MRTISLTQASAQLEQPSTHCPNLSSCIGLYSIIKHLQSGGQASVYLAEKEGDYFAIKVYHKGNHLVKYFENEAKLLENLQYKGLIPVYESLHENTLVKENERSEGRNAIVMGFAERGDLFDEVKKNGWMDEDACRYLLKSLVSSLRYLKSKHILHRDVKPENVLFGQSFQIYLTDFGLAIDLLAGKSQFAGDTHYSAPEVLKQIASSEQSEVFSLGVLLFFIHIGEYPFKTAKASDPQYRMLMEKKYKQYWESLEKKIQRKVSNEFKEMFISMSQWDPNCRPNYDSLSEMPWLEEKQLSSEEFTHLMRVRSMRLGKSEDETNFIIHSQ